VAGVLSGTSGDGIDVVLCRPTVAPAGGGEGLRLATCPSIAFSTRPFPAELASRVREALDGGVTGARGLALFSRDLGRAFGEAAREVAEGAGVRPDLVGSHGLTVYHHDGEEPSGPASLQLGDGDHVAEAAGCAVVSDFRQRDLAAGGEGAPISILADDLVFAAAPRPTAILNLGGMANLSWLPARGEPLAFDTGPAGCLLDGLARRLLDRPCDTGGAAAAAGRVRPELLAAWLDHPFFRRRPPKSTGRDTFGEAWLDRLLAGARSGGDVPSEDLLATGVELVARAIRQGTGEHLPQPPERLWVAGGGVHNGTLIPALTRLVGPGVAPSSAVGVDPDAREALVFAVLAARTLLGEPVTQPSATGGRAGRVLGKISPPAG